MSFYNQKISFDHLNDSALISETIRQLDHRMQALSIDPKTAAARLVFCEELMLSYAEKGFQEMTLSLKGGRKHPSLELCIPGEMQNCFEWYSDNRGNTMQEEIKACVRQQLFDSGAFWAAYKYAHQKNMICIQLSNKEEGLSQAVTQLYQEHGEELKQKPLLLFREFIRMDPIRCIGAFVNRVVKRGSLLLIPYCTAALIDRVVQKKPFLAPETALIIAAALLLLVINCVSNFWFDRILYSRKLREIEAALKLAALEKIQTLSMETINSLSSGELLHKVIQDTNQIRLLMTKAVEGGFQFLVDLTMILIMTLSSSPAILLFFLVTIPLTVFLILKFREPIRVKTEKLRRLQARVTSVIRDMQEMQVLTRIHGLQKTETRIYANQLNRARQAGDEYDNVFHSFSTASFFIFEFFKLFCLSFSAYLASRSFITVGMVLLFQSYFESMVNSVTKLIEAFPEITQGYDGLKSLNEILCLNKSEQNGSHILGTDMRGEIEFRNVVFGYDNDIRPVIDHLSFRIPAGKSAAFVGESGSGKSTVLKLMTGLLRKKSGNILIDGVDIDDIDKTSYHPKIAVVPQTTTLFAGSLLDNLVYGNPYVLTEEAEDIIEKIGLSDVIKSLPDGLYSSVLESGKNFSGGQRQRIAIARALLRKPKILFFDEATSALDQDSEEQIQNAVDSMMGKCTMVMIAHRLTTIRKCDYIIRLSRTGARIYEGYDAFMKGLKTDE